MARRIRQPNGMWEIRPRLLWDQQKLDVVLQMAERNGVTLDDMLDLILEDWAAMANHEIGNTQVPRRLGFPGFLTRNRV